jgi:hypothetical protein
MFRPRLSLALMDHRFSVAASELAAALLAMVGERAMLAVQLDEALTIVGALQDFVAKSKGAPRCGANDRQAASRSPPTMRDQIRSIARPGMGYADFSVF